MVRRPPPASDRDTRERMLRQKRSDTAPERRRTRRTDAADRVGKAFYRPRPVVTTGDFFDTNFVPGYN